jgi:prolyl-tRNA editing enzyme YbaK/EbsC (Cys-tRNA(Pro) deacylase)
MTDRLTFVPALSRPELLAPPVEDAIRKYNSAPWISDVCVAEIDPESAGGTAFCARYGISLQEAGNCVVIEARRGARTQKAACLVTPDNRTDLNGVVRRHFNARRVSLLQREQAVRETNMEYGSITVVGLPADWTVLIDSRLSKAERVVVGSGRICAKLRLPGSALVEITNGIITHGLGQPLGEGGNPT